MTKKKQPPPEVIPAPDRVEEVNPVRKAKRTTAPRKELTADYWKRVRRIWEDTPKCSYERAAKLAASEFGVVAPTRQTVDERAKREAWIKSRSLAEINKASQKAADLIAARREKSDHDLDSRETVSEDLRANKIDEHRSDWPVLRKMIMDASIEMREAPKRAAELVAEEDAKREEVNRKLELSGKDALKPMGLKDRLSILRMVQTAIFQRIEAYRLTIDGLDGIQKGEWRAWGLDEMGEQDAGLTKEQLEKMDAHYLEIRRKAEEQRALYTDPARRLSLVANNG